MAPSFKNWIFATRPWSYPASAISAFVAFSYIFFRYHNLSESLNIKWSYGLLAILGAIIFQAGSNVVNDYFDFRHGVDTKESYGINRLLVDGVFQPRTFLWYGSSLLAAGALLGLFLLFNTGIGLFWIGLAGLLSAFFYYKLKYIALGDILIYVIFGPMIMLGTMFVMTNELNTHALILSVPLGFLIVNILHANNTRDILHDGRANIKTQAMLLGARGAVVQYIVLAAGAYVSVALMAAAGMLHPLTLTVFITLPIAVMNCKKIMSAQIENPELIKDLDEASAKLVLAFGGLLSLSNFLAVFI